MHKLSVFAFVGFATVVFSTAANATCPTFHNLTNGFPADATQVMDNYNYILQCPYFTGNRIGLAVTPPAWSSSFDSSIDFGPNGALDTISSANVVDLQNNLYNGSAGYTRKIAGYGQMFRMGGSEFQWWQAGNSGAGTTATLTETMSLDSSGKLTLLGGLVSASVGIGTTSPIAPLQIVGGSGVVGRIGGTDNTAYSTSSYGGIATIYVSNSSTTAGTGSGITFSVVGAGPGSVASIAAISTAANYSTALVFQTRSSGGTDGEKMRITSTGNIGIGTTSPGQKLDVAGTIRQSNCTTAGTLSTNASGDIICTSDARLKNVLGAYDGGLNAITQIKPQQFTYKPTSTNPIETFVHAGFIAQNVKQVIPQAVALQRSGYYSLDTTAILAASVNAIKELNAANDRQTATIARLLAQNAMLAGQLEQQAADAQIMRTRFDALERKLAVRTAENHVAFDARRTLGTIK